MKLKKYIAQLQELVKKHPEVANYEAIYARDDEGNGYQKVDTAPSIVVVENLKQYYVEVEDQFDVPNERTNAIVIN